jgi:hypothetical protein
VTEQFDIRGRPRMGRRVRGTSSRERQAQRASAGGQARGCRAAE